MLLEMISVGKRNKTNQQTVTSFYWMGLWSLMESGTVVLLWQSSKRVNVWILISLKVKSGTKKWILTLEKEITKKSDTNITDIYYLEDR